jgi:L1 cell adhesion molecule like protein
MEKAITDALHWLENNQLADKEEFEFQQKELEGICSPVITRIYQSSGGAGAGAGMGGMGGMPEGMGAEYEMPSGGMPGGSHRTAAPSGPHVEEVD